MGDNEITDREPEASLHVGHANAAYHAGNGYESHSRKRGSYHPERNDVPRRLAIPPEKSVIVRVSVGCQPGNEQQKPEIQKYGEENKKTVHDNFFGCAKIYRILVFLPSELI